ncbi:hypothetical protein EVAR_71694_1, partial [Eumeta japonica]
MEDNKFEVLSAFNLDSTIALRHCTFRDHARRLGLPYNDFCRSCHDEDEEETVLHLHGTCRVLGGTSLILCAAILRLFFIPPILSYLSLFFSP